MAYIYKITNQVNGKMYIGKTEHNDPLIRWKEHQRASRDKSILHRPLYSAIRKYGLDNFKFEVIERTNYPEQREQYYIALYNTYHNGYNATLGGDGSKLVNENAIIALYNEVQNLSLVAMELGHDIKTVRRVLKNAGITIKTCVEFNKESFSKPVIQLNKKTGEVIARYNSASDAGRAVYAGADLKSFISHIIDVCNGKRKSTGGYAWKYEN